MLLQVSSQAILPSSRPEPEPQGVPAGTALEPQSWAMAVAGEMRAIRLGMNSLGRILLPQEVGDGSGRDGRACK